MRNILLLIVAVVFGWITPAESYELQGDAGLLQQAISSLRENWSGVKTWTGTVVIEDIEAAKELPEQKWVSEVEYTARLKSDESMWKLNVTEGENLVAFPRVNGLVQGNQMHLLRKTRPTLTSDSISDSFSGPRDQHERGPFAQSFEPFWFLGYQGEVTAERFAYIHDNSQKLSNDGWSVASDGDLVTLAFETPSLLNRYVVDLAKGGNLVSYRGEERLNGRVQLSDNWMWSFKEHDKTWLPVEMAIQRETYGDETSSSGGPVPITSRMRFIRWSKSQINSNDASELTPSAIGINDERQIQ